MNYKLICSDIDGTLLNKHRDLSLATIQEIKRVSPIPFILISSRMPKAMRHLQIKLDNTTTPLIAYNGAYILDNETVLESTYIDNKVLKIIIQKCELTSIHLSLYHADDWYVPKMDYWAEREMNNTKVKPLIKSSEAVLSLWESEKKGAHKIMCMGDENEIDTLYKSLEKEQSEEIMLYRSKASYIEISHISISKKTAIEVLLKTSYPHITMEEVIAFGDNYNDIEMIQTVGMGIAVANANEAVMQIAKKVTDTNKNDGVAKAIKDLF
jgi:Cof subfamily protein (haloacid dehalogenase superfamily)